MALALKMALEMAQAMDMARSGTEEVDRQETFWRYKMIRFGYTNELKRMIRAEHDSELAEHAAKIDAIIVISCCVGLAIYVIMQAVERWLA